MAKSNSLWYPRYIGDYKRKTSHLSMTEHGAYAMLMDHYYSTGQPLPTNVARLKRICSAFEDHEVEALNSILREFFVRADDGYHHERADEELIKRSKISEKRKNAVNSRRDRKPTNVTPFVNTSTTTSTSDVISGASESPHIALAREILKVFGTDLDDQKWFGLMERCQRWLKAGWSPENLILAAARKYAFDHAGQAPPNLKYFEAVVQTFADDLSRPLPDVKNVNGTRKPDRATALADSLATLDRLGADDVGPLESFADIAGGPIIDQPASSH